MNFMIRKKVPMSRHVKFFQEGRNTTEIYYPDPEPHGQMFELDAMPFMPRLEQNEIREVKDKQINYISPKLATEMYDLLMYSGDLRFSSISAELFYSRTRLNDEDFVNWCAAYYFANKKNMLFHEMLENNYLKFFNANSFCTLKGTIDMVGQKARQEVFIFNPSDSIEEISKILLQKGSPIPQNSDDLFKEGEFVLLIANKEPTEGSSETFKKEDSMLNTTLSAISRDETFLTDIGLDIIHGKVCLMSYIAEIGSNSRMKLYLLGNQIEIEQLKISKKEWRLVRPETVSVPNYIKINDVLKQFCTKVTMNPKIQQIVLSTPICNHTTLTRLARSTSPLINPNLGGELKSIVMNLEERLNPSQLESLQFALTSNVTIIQAPPGTNKILTIVEVIKAWMAYSPMQILIYSKNKLNLDLIHMALLKTGLNSLNLTDDVVNEQSMTDSISSLMTMLCGNNFFLNPSNINPDIMKAALEEFRIVCASTDEVLCDSLKSNLLM